jgi:hypothetical protein
VQKGIIRALRIGKGNAFDPGTLAAWLQLIACEEPTHSAGGAKGNHLTCFVHTLSMGYAIFDELAGDKSRY